MKKNLNKFLKSTVLTGSILTSCLVGISASAQNSFPITFIAVNIAGDNDGFNVGKFQVPDKNTTVSAGEGLRRYDAHIAKMFEITHHECQDSNFKYRGISWYYEADNGNIDMGKFNITCKLARDIAQAYGLGKAQATNIIYYRADNVVNIPTLNITGDKVNKWLNFVQGFKPRKSTY
jgi:hypothetical protein